MSPRYRAIEISMTKPAKRTQRDKIAIYLKRQAWILFILIVLGWIVDVTWLGNNGNTFVIAKSNAIGAVSYTHLTLPTILRV